jgi:hypothetical protein
MNSIGKVQAKARDGKPKSRSAWLRWIRGVVMDIDEVPWRVTIEYPRERRGGNK